MKRTITISALVLAAAACGGPEINTSRDSSIPIPASATWAWGKRDTISQHELDPAAANPILHQMVQAALVKALAGKGWQQVDDPSQANLVVTYHVGIQHATGYQTTSTGTGGWYGGYGWGYYGAPTFSTSYTTPVNYTTGALLVFVRQASSGKVAWQGLWKKDVSQTATVTEEKVQKAVDDLLYDLK